MRNRTNLNVDSRARVWERVLKTLWRRGSVEADRIATEAEVSVREIRAVCDEMAALGWLELRGENGRWVAGEAAADLLRRYPALRADVAPSQSNEGRPAGSGR